MSPAVKAALRALLALPCVRYSQHLKGVAEAVAAAEKVLRDEPRADLIEMLSRCHGWIAFSNREGSAEIMAEIRGVLAAARGVKP